MGGGVGVEQIISTSDIDKARKQLRNKEFHSETPSEAGECSDQGSIRAVPHRLSQKYRVPEISPITDKVN
jgi:hypothetical protein